jgi:hypothetical protein
MHRRLGSQVHMERMGNSIARMDKIIRRHYFDEWDWRYGKRCCNALL